MMYSCSENIGVLSDLLHGLRLLKINLDNVLTAWTSEISGIQTLGLIPGLFLTMLIDFKTRASSFSPLSDMLDLTVLLILLKGDFAQTLNLSEFKPC